MYPPKPGLELLLLASQVVTTARQWAEDSDSNQIPYGFDQEAAMSLMVRWMNFKYGLKI